MLSDFAPVAGFTSVHGLNSVPTYILVFTISRCLLRYLFLKGRCQGSVVTFIARHVTISRDLFSKQLLDKSWEEFYLFIV